MSKETESRPIVAHADDRAIVKPVCHPSTTSTIGFRQRGCRLALASPDSDDGEYDAVSCSLERTRQSLKSLAAEATKAITLCSIEDARDWDILVHKDLFSWLQENVRNKRVRYEFCILYQTFLKRGEFSINKNRFCFCAGGQASAELKDVLVECPFIDRIENHRKGQRSAVYTFNLQGVTQLLDNGFPASSCRLRVGTGLSSVVIIPGDWILTRSTRWAKWCETHGHELRLDLFGHTRLGRATFNTLSRMTVAVSDQFLGGLSSIKRNADRCSPRDWADWFHKRLLGKNGGFLRAFMSKEGRSYHPITQASAAIRSQLLLDGEPLAEADLGSSYWYLLATQLPRSTERDRLAKMIHDGSFYEQVAEFAGVSINDRSHLKEETQRQCLFGRDWRLDQRPLARDGLRYLLPGVMCLINRVRQKLGISGFAKYLMRLEGRLMDTVHHRLIDEGIAALRLHDGILVARSNVSQTANTIRTTGIELFGIAPLVREK